jgi:hypothetical protein
VPTITLPFKASAERASSWEYSVSAVPILSAVLGVKKSGVLAADVNFCGIIRIYRHTSECPIGEVALGLPEIFASAQNDTNQKRLPREALSCR